MNKRLPSMAEECAAVSEQMGYYLPPYKLAELMKIASKVFTTITSSKTQCTYAECRLILGMVEDSLKRGMVTEEEPDF